MKLIIILGPHAVGKMTVGQELAKLTGLKLFHNHMTIELVSNFFSYGSDEGKRLVKLFRQEIFESVAKSDLPGMIFTFMFAFDIPSEYEYIDSVKELFERNGAEVCFVELFADFDVRIERNKTENRLLHKPTKRNIEWSEKLFRNTEEKYRLNTREDEYPYENYFKLDNTNLSAQDAARIIMDHFELEEYKK